LTGSAGGNSFTFVDYNAISFGDFTAGTGDIEGRLAAAGDVYLGEGYSIGATLSTVNNIPDNHEAYSLIVGGSLTWLSGELFPSGTGLPSAGAEEDAYVAGTLVSAPADITTRVTSGSSLASVFSAAQTCYEGYSDTLASLSDNAAKSVYWSGLFITCSDATLDQYVISLTPTDLAGSTYTVLDSCNFQARWTINVRGTGDVTFTGASFPTIPGGTVYNVIGSRNVFVHDTSLAGHLLAPRANLNQTNGVIVGKVVANSVLFSLQINSMSTCPDAVAVTYTIIAAGSAPAGANTVAVSGASTLRVGDITSLGQIIAITGNEVTFSNSFSSPISSGTTIGTCLISSDSARNQVPNPTTNSASVAGVAFAVVAVAALLI